MPCMKTPTADRTGVLILRLWIEANHETGLRARITQTLDTMSTEHSVAVASSTEDICSVVRSWVDEFVAPKPLDSSGEARLG